MQVSMKVFKSHLSRHVGQSTDSAAVSWVNFKLTYSYLIDASLKNLLQLYFIHIKITNRNLKFVFVK